MGIPVVIKPSGGLPVTLSPYGTPMTEASNGFGIAVTEAPNGLPVAGITFGATLALSASSVPETAAVNTTVGTLSLTPGTTGTPVYTLADSAGGKFNISGTSLRTNALLDYETATFHNVTVAVSGVTPAVANRVFTISVTDVAEPVIVLTGTTVNEDAAVNTTVGTLSIANSYTGTPVYTLTDSAGGKFNVSGALLRTNAALDYETATTHSVTVAVTGITPAAPNKAFTVVVLDVEDSGGGAPTSPPTTALWGWWDAEHAYAETLGTPITPVTSDGASVGSLEDRSGGGHHIRQGVAPPILKTAILNSKPAVRFSAASNSSLTTAPTAPTGNNFTMYVVCNQTARSTNYDGLISNNDSGLTPRFAIVNNTSSDANLRVFNSSTGAIATFSASTYHLVAATVDNTGSFPTTLQIDNNAIVSANTSGGGNLGAVDIGYYYNGVWTGDVLEVLFYTATHNLASGDGLLARQYLDNKYNLGLGLSGGGGGGVTKNIVLDYGAVGDGEWALATLTIAASATALTSSTSLWTPDDAGKTIVVGAIGAGGNALNTTIAAYNSATSITLANPAIVLLSAAPTIVAWGTNNATAFQAFRDEYQGETVTLTIPAGTYLISSGNFGGLWDGIRNITVNAPGATICGGLFQIQASAQYQDTLHDARTVSVTAGATSVTLTTPSETSRFVVGNYAMMSGYDLQAIGFPSNLHLFEFLKIIAIDNDIGSPTYGKITFLTPLRHSYLSTWPHYYDGEIDYGGPATLYAMHPNFDHTSVVNGLTIAHHQQWAMAGKDLTFNDCTFHSAVGNAGPHPTMAISVVMNNCVAADANMEVDKQVENFELNGCTWSGISIQSSSVERMVLDDTTVTYTINGTPQELVIRNGCSIGTLAPGPSFFGYAHDLEVSDSIISAFTAGGAGVPLKGGSLANNGMHVDYTMSGGTITVPSSMRPPAISYPSVTAFAIAGEKMFFTDGGTIGSFTITAVEEGPSGSVLVHTDWPLGGFPPRTYNPASGLFFLRHPAPVCTFTNVTGCAEVVDLCNTSALGQPLNSYTKRTYTGSSDTGHYLQLWGRFKYIKVTVTTPYTGSIGTVIATLENSNNQPAKMSDRTNAATWSPIVNLKTAGVRIFDATAGTYPVTWTGGTGGDSLFGQAEGLWCTGNFRTHITDVSSDPGATPMVFTVEVITDQGF